MPGGSLNLLRLIIPDFYFPRIMYSAISAKPFPPSLLATKAGKCVVYISEHIIDFSYGMLRELFKRFHF